MKLHLLRRENPRGSGDLARVESIRQLGWCDNFAGFSETDARRDHCQDLFGTASGLELIGQSHCAVALRESFAFTVQRERNVGVRRRFDVEQLSKVRLTRRRGQEVVAADHLIDVLRTVVDDNGEVVGGYAVSAEQDDVVDLPRHLAEQFVVHGERIDVGP